MKIISKLVLIIGLSVLSFAHAEGKNDEKGNIYLSYCSHFGSGVSYLFQSCVNSNFYTIAQEIGGFFPYCTNFGNEVDYFYTSCVNSSFREAQRQLQDRVWLQDCYNYDRRTLDFSFISCVNSNYNQIQREVGRPEL